MIPSDMPKEYSDYGYWNKSYFLASAQRIGSDTKVVIERVMEKFLYPIQSFRSCYSILRFAEKYRKQALEACCHDAILHGKCSYTYISMYANPAPVPVDRIDSSLKPVDRDAGVTGAYKDDHDKYSLKNLLKRQEEGESR